MNELLLVLTHVFGEFFSQDEIVWIAGNMGKEARHIKECPHCTEMAMGIAKKVMSPFGTQFVLDVQNKTTAMCAETLKELDELEAEQMAIVQAEMDALKALLSLSNKPEDAARLKEFMEAGEAFQTKVRHDVAERRVSVQATMNNSKKHFELLVAHLAQFPGPKN